MPNVRRAAHGRRDFQLEFRDSLTEMDSRLRGNDEDGRDARAPRGCMDSRFRGNDGQPESASLKAKRLAEMTSFPRKRESIA